MFHSVNRNLSRFRGRRIIVLSSCGLFVALASVSQGAYRSVRIGNIPHVKQKSDFCGEACAEMYLRKLGKRVTQDDVFNQSGLDPTLGRGCYTRDLVRSLQRIGFRLGRVWHSVNASNAPRELETQFAALHRDLRAGVPSIVCMHYDDKPKTTEHFRLVVGYDAVTDSILYHEPAKAEGGYLRMMRTQMLKLWPLKYDKQRWTLIRLRLEPERIRAVRESGSFTNADYAQHVMKLKEKLPEGDFHIVLQRPFVVVGDEAKDVVRQRALQTVKWSVDRLKRAYFKRDPRDIIDIWLFKDKESYEKNAEKLFGAKPHTRFGYYSPSQKSLVMNISTGGGTLVHEIVHPFIASNFPRCPSWFNEGLASLYEQSSEYRGNIWGLTNWRLKGLQKAIVDEKVPEFEELCSTTTRQFYDEDKGTNYSQARYLCYYLQQQGLLAKYYHAFRANAADDPTGLKTLKQVLGVDDLKKFKKDWEHFVMRLRFGS